METGSISTKIERGKHTTRHSELIAMEDNTYILDTPGFSSLGLFDMEILVQDNKKYIHITVARGDSLYHIKGMSLTPDSCFIRVGSSTEQMSTTLINKMLDNQKEETMDMCKALQDIYNDGVGEGRDMLLAMQIQKKRAKGFTEEEIAEMLEITVDEVKKYE